jgi:excisionase family DNA binding protein
VAKTLLIGVVEAAELLGIQRRQVNNLIRDGRLPADKIGNAYIIRRVDLAKVPKNRKPGPKPKGKSDHR